MLPFNKETDTRYVEYNGEIHKFKIEMNESMDLKNYKKYQRDMEQVIIHLLAGVPKSLNIIHGEKITVRFEVRNWICKSTAERNGKILTTADISFKLFVSLKNTGRKKNKNRNQSILDESILISPTSEIPDVNVETVTPVLPSLNVFKCPVPDPRCWDKKKEVATQTEEASPYCRRCKSQFLNFESNQNTSQNFDQTNCQPIIGSSGRCCFSTPVKPNTKMHGFLPHEDHSLEITPTNKYEHDKMETAKPEQNEMELNEGMDKPPPERLETVMTNSSCILQ